MAKSSSASKTVVVKLTELQLTDIIRSVEYTRRMTGQVYTWPGDPAVRRDRATLRRLLRKLEVAKENLA
jgi:hypothetical protein